MTFLLDILAIVFSGLRNLSPATIGVTFLLASLLSVGCWMLCNYCGHLWNKAYKAKLIHKLLSGLAACLTFFFVVAFASFSFFQQAAELVILNWQYRISHDRPWQEATFKKAYTAVKACCQAREPFQEPAYRSGKAIPVTTPEALEACTQTYANEGCIHFDRSHPFLAKIIWSSPQVSRDDLKKDIQHYFETTGKIYPTSRGIELVANEVKKELNQQTPRVVTLARTVLVILFFMVQAIPLGFISLAAYTSLRVKV